MSKQLTLSATAAVVTMAAFAAVAGLGGFATERTGALAGHAPFYETMVSR